MTFYIFTYGRVCMWQAGLKSLILWSCTVTRVNREPKSTSSHEPTLSQPRVKPIFLYFFPQKKIKKEICRIRLHIYKMVRVAIELSLLSKYPVVNNLYSAIFSLDIQIFYFLWFIFLVGGGKIRKITWLVVDSRLAHDSRLTWARGWLV